MSATISIRVDEETADKLAALARRSGSRNAAVVAAIHAAYREFVLDQLRGESRVLAEDSSYRADVEAARADMGAGDAW